MPKITTKTKELATGLQVTVKGYGKGTIEKVATQEHSEGNYEVFHVRLENGEVRHFVGSLIEVQRHE